MPIDVERDDGQRRVVARVSGSLLLSELLDFVEFHRTGAARNYSLLFDLREATTIPPATDLFGFADVLAVLSRRAPRGRAALVGSSVEVFGAIRQFEEWCAAKGVTTVRAYRTINEADAWLTGE
jgi:hypothetical protein